MGEEICACIRLKEGEKTTAEEIKAFCKGKVGASSHPKHRHVAQFSNTLCLLTCQPTAHCDTAWPHALIPFWPADLPLQDSPVHRFCHKLPPHRLRKGM